MKMEVDLAFRHEDFMPVQGKGRTLVVIDVLRATTSITTALANGALTILPVILPDEAFILREKYKYLLAGERGGLMIEGFDFGNSPAEFAGKIVNKKTIVFCTSNGTKAMLKASEADEIILACFLNVHSIIDHAARSGRSIFILCSGTLGEPSLEDTVCGGMIADALDRNLSPPALSAKKEYLKYKSNLIGCMRDSHHGRHLMKIGFGSDLDFAAQVNTTEVIPVVHKLENALAIFKAPPPAAKKRLV
jgi:2-phosphosulfolactate phosphatase